MGFTVGEAGPGTGAIETAVGIGWLSARHDGLPLESGPFPLYSYCLCSVFFVTNEQLFFLKKNPDTTLGVYRRQVLRSNRPFDLALV